MGLNVRGINQYAKFSNGHLGNVWYSNTGLTVHQNGWYVIYIGGCYMYG